MGEPMENIMNMIFPSETGAPNETTNAQDPTKLQNTLAPTPITLKMAPIQSPYSTNTGLTHITKPTFSTNKQAH